MMTDWTQIILVFITPFAAAFGVWFGRKLNRTELDKALIEIEKLREELKQMNSTTVNQELDNVRKSVSILMSDIVEPLKKQLSDLRKEVGGLRRAVEKSKTCKYLSDCPVVRGLQDLERNGNDGGECGDCQADEQPRKNRKARDNIRAEPDIRDTADSQPP